MIGWALFILGIVLGIVVNWWFFCLAAFPVVVTVFFSAYGERIQASKERVRASKKR